MIFLPVDFVCLGGFLLYVCASILAFPILRLFFINVLYTSSTLSYSFCSVSF